MAREGPLLPGLALYVGMVPPILIAIAFSILVAVGAYHGGRAGREEELIGLVLLLLVAAAVVDATLFVLMFIWSRFQAN